MANNTQEFKTIVSLNAKQAQDELQKLKKHVEDLKKKKDDALKNNGSWSKQDAKDLKQATAAVEAYQGLMSDALSAMFGDPTSLAKHNSGNINAAMTIGNL